MPGLEEFGITPRRATPSELEEALVSVQVGVADPMVKTLLCHIATLTTERDELASRLGEGTY